MSAENTLSSTQRLRDIATEIEGVSRREVGIEKFYADYLLGSIPLAALVGGVVAGGGGMALLDKRGFVAALIALGSCASGVIVANSHGDDKMRVSEWIGPGIAKGLRIGANIAEAFGSQNR